jgi:hypothetical protein
MDYAEEMWEGGGAVHLLQATVVLEKGPQVDVCQFPNQINFFI